MRTKDFYWLAMVVCVNALGGCGRRDAIQPAGSVVEGGAELTKGGQETPKNKDFPSGDFVWSHRPKEACFAFDVKVLASASGNYSSRHAASLCLDLAYVYDYTQGIQHWDGGLTGKDTFGFASSAKDTLNLNVGRYQFTVDQSKTPQLRSIYWFGFGGDMVETYSAENAYNGVTLMANWDRHLQAIAQVALTTTDLTLVELASLNLSEIRPTWSAKWASMDDAGNFGGKLVGLPQAIVGKAYSPSEKAWVDLVLTANFEKMTFFP